MDSPPPFQQPSSSSYGHLQFPVETNYRRNAVVGHILLFGTLGVILAVVLNIVAGMTQHYIVIILANVAIPLVIGFGAGNSVIKHELPRNLGQAALMGAGAAGLTAVIFAVIFCSCVSVLVLSAAEEFQQSGDSFAEFLNRSDFSASMAVLILLGVMLGAILLYTVFGAIGAAVAGAWRDVDWEKLAS